MNRAESIKSISPRAKAKLRNLAGSLKDVSDLADTKVEEIVSLLLSNNIIDEELFHRYANPKTTETAKSTVLSMLSMLLLFWETSDEKDQIHRSIEFAPEYRQAGLQILNYFNETLIQKYPDDNVVVRISQSGNKVTMEIETPDGRTELYEKALDEYGLVVTGKMPIDKYLDNPIDILALEHKLENAMLELKFQQQLLTMKDQVIENKDQMINAKDSIIDRFNKSVIKMLSKAVDQSATQILTEIINTKY
ncbi:MAG: hypothetical protein HEP71_27720 [Roseivirga sp.]|nr:hypothetical protein [Roseivirga sp.]